MFGAFRPQSSSWSCSRKREWASHYCGVCVALGASFGQAARLATNFDATLISVLIEAQRDEPVARESHVCPLRGFRRLEVVVPTAGEARYAASLSASMVAAKLDDHASDGDGPARWFPELYRSVAARLRRRAEPVARSLGFDSGLLDEAVTEQAGRESHPDRDFLYYSAPTERSAAAAFEHTAELAGRLENCRLLGEIGALYGRMIYVLDAFRDLDGDLKSQRFNALNASSPGNEPDMARALFYGALRRCRQLVGELTLLRPALLRELLVELPAGVGQSIFGPDPEAERLESAAEEKRRRSAEKRRRSTEKHRKKAGFDRGDCCGCSCDCCFDCLSIARAGGHSGRCCGSADCCCSGACCCDGACCCCDC